MVNAKSLTKHRRNLATSRPQRIREKLLLLWLHTAISRHGHYQILSINGRGRVLTNKSKRHQHFKHTDCVTTARSGMSAYMHVASSELMNTFLLNSDNESLHKMCKQESILIHIRQIQHLLNIRAQSKLQFSQKCFIRKSMWNKPQISTRF